METSRSEGWGRKRVRVVAVAVAAAFVVGCLVSPGLWSAVSAMTPGATGSAVKDAKCGVGSAPTGSAYDPVDHEVYVPNELSHNISVVKAPCTVAATIKLASDSEPEAAAFDPQNNYVYVTDFALNEVYLISGNKIVTTLISADLDAPYAIAYDPTDAAMVVTNYAGDNVTEIAGTTIYSGGGVGVAPDAIEFNSLYDWLVVANWGSGNVTLLKAGSLQSFFNIQVGSEPDGVVYDPANLCDYVANFGSDSVSVVSGEVVANTLTGFNEPSSATWSQANLAVYVANYGSGGLWYITGSFSAPSIHKISSHKGIGPAAYDDATDDIYVADGSTGFLYVYST